MIPDDVIAEIRTRVDIVAVIGEHVQLKKAGRNWKGLCPFHGEKSPSFNVSPDKGFFFCFGCQKKGDAFTFVMEYGGKSFTEAAEELAARAGIAIPRVEESPELRRARGERAALLEINRTATTFFRAQLLAPGKGDAGRAYLDERGIRDEIRERFQLGLAPAEWHALADALDAARHDLEQAVRLGLVARQPKAGGFYDRFRHRLVCPVIVPGGDVVGFSARLLAQPVGPDGQAVDARASEAPKYINSPESPVYKKGRLLFGLAQAREAMAARKRVILVEGNFDVISLHQAGFAETVAPLGTALTPEQIEQLRRMADQVVLCYDGDRAGRAATRNALELLLAADVPCRVVMLPDGEDPDSLIRQRGPDPFKVMLDRAPGGIEHFCDDVWSRARGLADGHARAIDDAARAIIKIGNPTVRDLITGRLAAAMGVSEDVLARALGRARGNARGADTPDDRNRPAFGNAGGNDRGSFRGPGNDPGSFRGNDRGSFRPGGPGGNDRGSFRPSAGPTNRGPTNRGSFRGPGNNPGSFRGPPDDQGSSDGRFDDRPPPYDDDARFDGAPPFDDRPPPGPMDRDDRGPAPRLDSAPSRPQPPAAPARSTPTPPTPSVEIELMALLSDHPALATTPDADKAFSLLTDARLRAICSAAREGAAITELAASTLPSSIVETVLSGRYATHANPSSALAAMLGSLQTRAKEVTLRDLQRELAEAKRQGDADRERQLSLLIVHTRNKVD